MEISAGNVGNLIVKLPGTVRGPRRLLMAHMDTVPVCLGAQPVPDGLARFAGTTFQQALDSLAIGEVSQPIETRFGVHLLEVEGRTTTRLEDVAAGLREDLERAPPSLAERRAVLAELDATYGIRDAARQRVPR